MENLKNKNTIELFEDVDELLYTLLTHNKNYTKEQYNNIIDLVDYIEELKARIL